MVVGRQEYVFFYLPRFMNVAANMLAVIMLLITAKNQVCGFGSLTVGLSFLLSGSLFWAAGWWDGASQPRCLIKA